tara:strand:- start:554 stop:1159 length:606 start_codon:yes stop_codon:yes gene_type:complete
MADAGEEPLQTSRRASEGDVDTYQAPEQKSVNELMEQKEGEDEAMKRYKESLLAGAGSAKTDDPRRVVVTEMQILFPDREAYVFNLEDEATLKGLTFVLKEGCQYKTQLSFRVQNEIVSGLKVRTAVKRMGVTVLKQEEMLGSYGPGADIKTAQMPRRTMDEAPSGMMARAKYEATTVFVDDDKVEHLKFSYHFEIKKDWK